MTRISDRRLELRHDPLLTEKVVYSVGPQHPSLPAPVRLVVQADGELIERVTPEIGYLHRGVEQLCARRSYAQCAALLSRCEWLAGANADYLVSAAVEQLAGIEVSVRAQWLRMLVLELSRILSHLFWWGQLGLEAGQITAVFWALREREPGLDLLELLSGHRWHHGWIVPGGVRREPPAEFYGGLARFSGRLREALEHFEEFFSDNAIWVNRSELIGTLNSDYAQAHGASGPVLRASGVDHDLRRDAPYLQYDRVSFSVPVGEYGDVLDRYQVRMEEMRQSLSIIAQCVEAIAHLAPTTGGAGGPARSAGEDGGHGGSPHQGIEVPAGEAYIAVEGPRGELGLSVVSEGGPGPARLHLRSPSLYHLHLLDELCRGYLLADLFVILGSLDIMIGEVDR
ncbi:NADH-quinone oxidoreductase subunit D [bacterium]|nr:NADH-quinone oxidoreductase subunit D [bacterium]